MDLELSIIIACYNCMDTLRRCLDSIPKNAGIEIVLVNDNSTDKTLSVIQQYVENYKKEKIICISNSENLGAGRTRNRGIEYATKKYITFLDSDDELSADFQGQIQSVLENNFDCIIFDAMQIREGSTSLIKMFYTNDLHEGIISQEDAVVFTKGATWGKLYNREIIREHNIQFGSIKRNEDLIFTKSALAYCNRIMYVEKPLYKYIDNANSLMHNKSLLTAENARIAVDSIKNTLLSRGLVEEFNSIYFLEIVYSTTLTSIMLGKTKRECRSNFLKANEQYNSNDKYRKRYFLKYRIAYFLFYLGFYDIFKIALGK